MNRYTDSYIEKDNQMTIGKLTNKTVYTFEEHATYENFSEAFLKQLIGVKMNYTQQLKQKDSEYVWHPFTQMGVYSKRRSNHH